MPAVPSPARVKPLAALTHPDFRLLYFGPAVSLLGSQFRRVAAAWLVWDLTGRRARRSSPGWCRTSTCSMPTR